MWWHNVLNMLQEWITVQTGTVRPEARGIKLSDELMGDAMRFVACHEVGHSLGLRHNMMGSWAFPHPIPCAPSPIHRPDEFNLFFHNGLCPFQAGVAGPEMG